jgi:hypothetical protein
MWASYAVIDVWYQKAEFGDVWMPYLHVRITPAKGRLGLHHGKPLSRAVCMSA